MILVKSILSKETQFENMWDIFVAFSVFIVKFIKEASTPENKNEKSSIFPVFKFSKLKFVICVL